MYAASLELLTRDFLFVHGAFLKSSISALNSSKSISIKHIPSSIFSFVFCTSSILFLIAAMSENNFDIKADWFGHFL